MASEGHLVQPTDIDPYERGPYSGNDDNLDNLVDNWDRCRKDLVLFLGAGASVGARNASGNRLPAAYSLRNEIYNEFVLSPSERTSEYDFSNLALLSLEHTSALADVRCGARALHEFVAERFFVDKPLWQHTVLPLLGPTRLFTTNYDTLIELGWQLQLARRDVKPLVPVYRKEVTNPRFTPLYKPHGSVERPHNKVCDGGLVITQFDYFEMLEDREGMLEVFLGNLDESCVVFVGYSFGDMDIASRLYSMRKSRGGQNWYAVFPRPDPDVRTMYWEKFRIRQINRRFHDFLIDLDARINFIPEDWKFDKLSQLVREGRIQGNRTMA